MSGAANGSTGVGIAFGVGAGALWGLVFLAPELVPAFSPLQLAAGRYFVYGLISAALIAPHWRMLRNNLKRSDWATLGWLALAGNTLYYALLTNAVQMGGIAMTSLVIGFLPVAVTIAGSRVTGAVPLRRLCRRYCFVLRALSASACKPWLRQRAGRPDNSSSASSAPSERSSHGPFLRSVIARRWRDWTMCLPMTGIC